MTIPAYVHYATQQLSYVDADRSEYRFGPWRIWFDPPPIPSRNCDWHFWHDDDDGAPDGSAARSGSEATLRDCLAAIDDLLDDMAEECRCSAVHVGDCLGATCPLRYQLEPRT